MKSLTIVVFCNKKDFFLTRICVSSIRYFYPSVKIKLVKDELNGSFSTDEIEKRCNVQIYDCGQKKFGWAAAKTIFLLQTKKDKKYLLLDSDIVFVEPFLERVMLSMSQSDIAVSAEFHSDIFAKYISEVYFDVLTLLEYDKDYKYPGYFFNTGQLFVKGGLIKKEHLADVFDPVNFPFWTRLDIFPLVDQSVYNYIFPKLQQNKLLRLSPQEFMVWSEGSDAKKIKVEDVIKKNTKAGIIHWAGAKRTPFIKYMSGADILSFFQMNTIKIYLWVLVR